MPKISRSSGNLRDDLLTTERVILKTMKSPTESSRIIELKWPPKTPLSSSNQSRKFNQVTLVCYQLVISASKETLPSLLVS